MQSIEVEGKNVEEALKKALDEFNTSIDNVEYEVLEAGSKGLFSIIGAKRAKIKVSKKNNYIDRAKEFMSNILSGMDLEAEIFITEQDDIIRVNLSGKKMGLVIGYRGETLDSIQYLLSLIVNKDHNIPHKKVILDTENYRSKREATLKEVAAKYANKVIRNRKKLKLEPMNPYERRIIHSALQDDKYVVTYSEGEEPFRRVVIGLK